MVRSRPFRFASSIAAFVAPILFSLGLSAAPAKSDAKSNDATAAKTETKKTATSKKSKAKAKKKKSAKDGKTAEASKKKLPPLPGSADAKSPQKEDISEDPPVELTGALPEAKLVDAKAKKKKTDDAKTESKKTDDAKTESKKTSGKKDDKKLEAKADEGKAKKKSEPTPRPEAPPGVDFGSVEKIPESKKPKIKTCLNPAVTFARLGQPTDVSFVLTTCKGRIAPGAVEYLSVLGRPYDLPLPKWMQTSSELGVMTQEIATHAMKTFEKTAKTKAKSKSTDEDLAPGIKRLDPGLVLRLQAIAEHFPSKTITLVSGYRPQSKGSPHSFGRAFDLRIDGVTNETLVAFCKTLKDTGCGYYPNSYFVHVDVRPAGAGHVYWIDVSGPGEKPHYVKKWPLEQKLPKLPPLPDPVPPTTDEAAIGDGDDPAASMDSPSIDATLPPIP